MSDLLKDQPTLDESEESGAIIGVVPGKDDTDETHKMDISELVDAQGRENPLKITSDGVELISFSGEDANNRVLASNTLAIREGSNPHSFADGYDSILVLVADRIFIQNSNYYNAFVPKFIPISTWNESNENEPITILVAIDTYYDIWKISDTSFGFSGTQSTTRYLASIYGIFNLVSITEP